MDDSFSFGVEGNFIEERNEDVDSNVRFVLGEGGDEEVFASLLDEKGGSFIGGGSEDDVGQRENFSLVLLCLVSAELVGLSGIQDFSEEHVYC